MQGVEIGSSTMLNDISDVHSLSVLESRSDQAERTMKEPCEEGLPANVMGRVPVLSVIVYLKRR